MSYILQEQGPYSSLNIDVGQKTGNYLTIGPSNHTTTARTLTIWIDHGQGPYTLNYNYLILPNISLDLTPSRIKQYDEEQVFSCMSTNKYFHGTMWPILKRASFVLWDNVSTTFSCKSTTFEVNIQLNDAGAYLFSETEQNFTLTVSHPTRLNGTVEVTVDRTGYGKGCTMSTGTNVPSTNISVSLPSSSELLGASMNITCTKQ